MTDLIIYGAGGFGRETALMIDQINQQKKTWNLLGFADDGKPKGELINDLKILGGAEYLNAINTPVSVVIAVADPSTRKKLHIGLTNSRLSFPAIVHPNARIGHKSNSIGAGSIITDGCILTTGIKVRTFVIVNLLSSIGHDVVIESYSSIMPACNISGNVKVGSTTLIGTGAKVLQNLSIGNDCVIGAGAVVTRDVISGDTVVGVPARSQKHD